MEPRQSQTQDEGRGKVRGDSGAWNLRHRRSQKGRERGGKMR
jgi:hypothetical protein